MKKYGIWGLIYDKSKKEIDDDYIRLWIPQGQRYENLDSLFKLERSRVIVEKFEWGNKKKKE